MLRVAAALIIMSLCAVFLVRYLKKNNIGLKNTQFVEILSSLRLNGRDMFFVLRCGPDVIAFTDGERGACFMGRWSYEEWTKSEKSEIKNS